MLKCSLEAWDLQIHEWEQASKLNHFTYTFSYASDQIQCGGLISNFMNLSSRRN